MVLKEVPTNIMNQCFLVGRLTKDPELKYTSESNTPVTSITVAVDDYNSKTKEKSANFIPVVLFGKQAENAAQYLYKGREVSIMGKINIRNYDGSDGKKHYVTEIIANPNNGIQYLGSNQRSTPDEEFYASEC